jgi:hypothetical protein
VLFEWELPCEVGDIAECLAGFPHPIERVGFEAGAISQHLFFGLTAEGFDVVWTCHSFVPVPCSVVMQLFVRKPVGFSNLMLSGDDVDCKIH